MTATKPHDVGNGLVAASFGAEGEWLSLATVDPDVGFVELTGLPVFDPELRGNEEAVIRYRSWMRRSEHAFLHVEAGRATISARQDAPRATRGLVQRLTIAAARPDRPSGIRIRFSGRLARPALAEIDEVDPPAYEADSTSLTSREGTLSVSGIGPRVIIQAWLRKGDAGSAGRRADQRVAWKPMRRRTATAVAWIEWPADTDAVHIDIACTFDRPAPDVPAWLTESVHAPGDATARRGEDRPLRVPARLVRPLGRMNQRAASYIRSCTALAVSGSERCVVADHRILPLSWTRDAYWQARLLLATWSRGGHDDDARIVADHLRWLFLRCDRPDGRWVRSHHADGRRKDRPFQAGQQLYPLLELAAFASVVGELPLLPEGPSWQELVGDAWSAAEGAIDEASGLIATEESPTGDALSLPYLLSDQVLLWHTSTALAALAPRLGLARGPFVTRASDVRTAVDERFLVSGGQARLWAYAVDAIGNAERYVDAADLPVFLAPLWGFCKPDDPAWQATMRFAFDQANPGYVVGPTGGLGSRHTPGTWTLGDIARWVASGLLGDRSAADASLARLVEVAFSDGMLPEAYDPEGAGSAVRHWFAWPGAALGALLLDHSARDTGE